MNEAKAHMDYNYEYSVYYSNWGEDLTLTLLDFIITVAFFVFVIFSASMLINCFFRGKFRHLNKILWLLIIIITWGFGAVPYFFLEYRKK
ncbi:hypothetical protein COZ55_00470 [archaeon CG_4_8_14_3_um_filter_38_5]|nr:MAG: hypothetical protein COS83_04535 [archaeon CG07_land_8_20_14_0_80_38_8]PIX44330.1 MAG: hypothetical protein COZ55_00470 [archaeon CG_4_8_14_3_um_filter_38_5]